MSCKFKILNYFYLKALYLNRSFLSTKKARDSLINNSKDRLIKSITFHVVNDIKSKIK